MAELPRNGHLVLSGRVVPPVALARIDVQGQVLRIGEAELSFTPDELAAFAAQRGVPGGRLTGSGGWPALAELVASAPAATGAEAAYLWEEVLAAMAPERRHDLALLAHVGAFDAELAAAALGHEVDLTALAADLPLVNRVTTGELSIHPLWRPYLAQAVTAAEVAEAQVRAGVALARSGEVAAAVRLLAEAEAWLELGRVLVDGLGTAQPPVPADIASGWRELLPGELRAGPLGQLLAAVATASTDPEAAAARLTAAMDGFRATGDLEGELACIAQWGQLAWWWEQPEQMVAVAARVIQLELDGRAQAGPLACLARAMVADVANDSARALAELDRIPAGSLNRTWQGVVEWLRSLSLHHLGYPAAALEAADRAGTHPLGVHAPLIEAARLQARWFHGQTDEVIDELVPLAERTAATGLHTYATLMTASCGIALALADRAEEAAAHVERARRTATSHQVPLVEVNLAIAQAAVAVARGDEAGAAAVLDDYLERSQVLGTGHAAAPQQRTLALWFVLLPRTRPVWEAADLGPAFTTARELARAFVDARAGASKSALTPDRLAVEVVRPHLPLRWSVELALHQAALGRTEGWTLLEALWPAAQPHVRRLADSEDEAASVRRTARTALGRLPVPPAGRLDLRLLGPLELRRDGVLVDAPAWRRERVRSLLGRLALDRSVSRERLADDLWPSLDTDSQSRNLRVTLTYLLRVLEPARGERDASYFIRPHGGLLALVGDDRLEVDVWRFDRLWAEATAADRRGAPSQALLLMEQAVALWRGDPSELAGEPWALADVEERRLRLVDMATRAGELLLAKDDTEGARRMGEAAVRADPWSERAHQVVIRAHEAVGDVAEARRARRRHREALGDL